MEEMKIINEALNDLGVNPDDIVETVTTPELQEAGIDKKFILKTGAIVLVIGTVLVIIKNRETIATAMAARKQKKIEKKMSKLAVKAAKYGCVLVKTDEVEEIDDVECENSIMDYLTEQEDEQE